MRDNMWAVALAWIVCWCGTLRSQEDNQPPDGFTALFNGKDLEGWHGLGTFDPRALAAMTPEERAEKRARDLPALKQHWSVAEGQIVNDGQGPYLTTDQEFGDFEMWIDYKTVPRADSGIYLRGNPQVQIWDYTEQGGQWPLGADKGSGGLWNNSPGAPGKDPLVLADRAHGEWNRFRVRQIGARTSVWLNGQLVVDHALMENYFDRGQPHVARGPIQLQTHGGEVRWRNIFIREIPPAEANQILAEHDAEGFQYVFNGLDFSGWEGPTSQYEIRDGVLMCRPGQGGTIYTRETYDDFVVRLEFQLPPGGNNGLAIRYPGEGDPAYSAMCELQVLDSEHPKYANLDPRQYHGSAYGMVAAHRGYLRPAGQWNFQQVTVRGSTIQVELNGTVILDADLRRVREYLGERPHPGKDRTRGHFGFAGHSDPVRFRSIRIKRLRSGGVQQAETVRFQLPVQVGCQIYLPPGYEESDEWPLIVFLHGAGERGSDLDRLLKHGPPKIAREKRLPFVVASPQCLEGLRWDPRELDHWLDEIVGRYNVDQDRIYLTGLSMGGQGTWQLAAYAPDRFAAIAPICGRGDTQLVDALRGLPTWVFHGAQDQVITLDNSTGMVEALIAAGSDVKLTVYPDASHDSWTATYDNPELYDWFLSHQRRRGLTSARLGNTRNVHRAEGFYLAGQPTSDDLVLAKRRGVDLVLDLRCEGEIDWDEPSAVEQAGMQYQRMGISGVGSMTDEFLANVSQILQETKDQGQEVLMHCGSANRVGALWLLHRTVNDELPWDEALREAREVGLRNESLLERVREYVENR